MTVNLNLSLSVMGCSTNFENNCIVSLTGMRGSARERASLRAQASTRGEPDRQCNSTGESNIASVL